MQIILDVVATGVVSFIVLFAIWMLIVMAGFFIAEGILDDPEPTGVKVHTAGFIAVVVVAIIVWAFTNVLSRISDKKSEPAPIVAAERLA